ncbi:MAG: HlyD family secretion protein [Roseibium sp.]|uniref:HlyD family secretion protein n=1 Tax=Roseibium sp. TaxID=1936156 RepID=UPI001B207E80|nr:HlyD family secretion protein [Roseibium sp.]MBO6892311.1 HlyD family secretion protein [Roseibium sp.]MBO6929864.1 HlyD family secretion protein [Roseibium sp.]
MFELIFCSLLTILPDFLIRRFVQGKRIGREITLYSVWYELRYGIVTCAMLTVSLITLIFYFHPTATSAVSTFRTIPILPEGSGRVEEVFVPRGLEVEIREGDPIFRLDSNRQEADVVTAKQRIAEVEGEIALAKGELEVADAQVDQAEASLKQAQDELDTKQELFNRNANVVSERDLEKLQNTVAARQGALEAAQANKDLVDTKINVSLPARLASAEAQLDEAEIELSKMTVYAGVDGTVSQFVLRTGDIVNPLMRPAGILIPKDAQRDKIIAGFGQIEAQVLKEGMVAEAFCPALPFKVIPLVVTEVQTQIAAGQVNASSQLFDATQAAKQSTITTVLEPLYKDGLTALPPGANCVVNAYTSNHERLTSGEPLSTGQFIYLHAIDTVGLVHAMLLRIQALLFPIQTLVLTGH